MIYAVMVLLLLEAGLLIAVLTRLTDILTYQRETHGLVNELKRLSLNPRTRLTKAAMRSGVETEERQRQKLGHLTIGKRVVVGGENGSVLNQDLERSVRRLLKDDEDG